MRKVTNTNVVSGLLRAVAANGYDYVYRRNVEGQCVNFTDGQPSCLVGHVYHYAGITITDLENAGECNSLKLNRMEHSTVAERLERAGIASFTPGATRLLVYVQRLQDDSVSWGDAVALAIMRFGKDL